MASTMRRRAMAALNKRIAIGREAEIMRALHEDRHRRPGRGTLGEKDRGDAGAQAAALAPAHRRDGEVDRLAGVLWRTGVRRVRRFL